MLTSCTICEDEPKGAVINALLASGTAPHRIEMRMKELGTPCKAETIRKHRDQHGVPVPTAAQATLEKIAPGRGKDFAAMVRDNAITLLEQGRMPIRAADGLKAQELIDRRAERKADRDLMVNLAQLLSGGFLPPPATVIEGYAEEVDGGPDLLAPGG